jgi:hypothetical protein
MSETLSVLEMIEVRIAPGPYLLRISAAAKEREFARRLLAVSNERREQGAGRHKFATQELHPLRLAQRLVVDARRRGHKKLGNRALVDVRVLPEVDGRQMKANISTARCKARRRPRATMPALVCLSERRDGREVGAESSPPTHRHPVDDRLT